MQSWLMLYTQDSNSPLMNHMIFTMDHSTIILIMISVLTSMSIMSSLIKSTSERMTSEKQAVEHFWSLVPVSMLLFIGTPSVKVLFFSDEMLNTNLSFKAIGHQWYWSYEMSNMEEVQMDSFMQNNNSIRLLSTDNHLIIPFKTPVRSFITSEDVIHSWTVPSLAVSADAIPGKINQVFMYAMRPMIMTGQCSELCGAGHSFMPIMLSSISKEDFIQSMNYM